MIRIVSLIRRLTLETTIFTRLETSAEMFKSPSVLHGPVPGNWARSQLTQ
jgi:hypothetical protein